MKKIKILTIGNSFSEDATAQIELFTDKISVRNAYIPGCSLERHIAAIEKSEAVYEYQKLGVNLLDRKVPLGYALRAEEWDYITIQQVSHLAGIYDSYYPYLTKLVDYIRLFSNAKILFHRTWAYEKGSEHSMFHLYENNRELMWSRVKETTDTIAAKEGFNIIDSGELIYRLTSLPEFDIERGGVSLYRDKFHLSRDLGRFALACLWIKYFTGDMPTFLSQSELPEVYKLITYNIEELQNV